ncbi:MAG: peptide chain release factor 1 [Chromatiales bacterium]|nr:peptide chain release factor 1 [Chromatiales bacterium]
MDPAIERRLEQLLERHEELSALLAEPDTAAAPDRLRDLSREYARLDPLARTWQEFAANDRRLRAAREMVDDSDPELRALARDEVERETEARASLEEQLEALLVPEDPEDAQPAWLEIRAGTGGAEAGLFAADLLRMYLRYAERRGWQAEITSGSPGELGGYKEVIARIEGDGVYGRLKFESGAHRVQRVPETESQGRIHTSACTVAVLPEIDEIEAIDLDARDLRIDTYRASGAGGQHVNKTDSAVRITHLPSGIVVECQDERSQHKNRSRAMSLLKARLLDSARSAQRDERDATRRTLVGSGDRSERIRTYNFPQGRLTDHRINLTLYRLEEILEGDLDPVLDPLARHDHAERLAELRG